jgi:hypothetical protein
VSGWLKGHRCAACGSTLVTWRYKEPHCYNCGSNLPYSDPVAINDIDVELLDISNVSRDLFLAIARILSERSK